MIMDNYGRCWCMAEEMPYRGHLNGLHVYELCHMYLERFGPRRHIRTSELRAELANIGPIGRIMLGLLDAYEANLASLVADEPAASDAKN